VTEFAKLKKRNGAQSVQTRGITIKGPAIRGLWLAVIAWITACAGGGGGGDSITLTTDNQGEDPVVLEIPVAYVKRPLPDEPTDLRDPLAFNPGAQLFVRERASTSADELNVTDQIAAIVAEEEGVDASAIAIDIKDLESSYDGSNLLFAARAVVEPVSANLEQSTWNLWTLDLDTLQAAYLISSRTKRNEGREAGGGQDIAPHYLPDDRIVFSSTRQVAGQALQLNEGRAQIFSALDEDGDDPATVLHIYDPLARDSEFMQISYNLSHDLDPTVLANGDIVFSRWNNSTSNHISLYRINPSGLQLSPLYGYHSQASGDNGARVEFTQPRELDDGRLVSIAKPFASQSFGGEIIVIDANSYVELDQPIWENQGGGGIGHEPLTETEVRTDGLLSSGGQFGSVYPLRDGSQRLLVTWSECRVIDQQTSEPDPAQETASGSYLPCTLQAENTSQAPPLYGAWVYNVLEDTQRPVVIAQEGFMISEIIAAEPREFPALTARPDSFDNNLAIQNSGRLLIDSVYDFDGSDESPLSIALHAKPGTPAYSNRPIRFIRITQPVPIPDNEVYEIPRYAYGVSTAFSFREIAGYAPVEPDGSVTVTVPANRPFAFSLLDANGRRVGQRHDYWLQVAPGELLHCTGCHSRGSTLAHGRLDSQPESANPGARALVDGTTGFPGTNSADLFATEPGQNMAQVWNNRRPLGNETIATRSLSLSQWYHDEWSAPSITPDPDISDRDYDPAWIDIPADKKIIVSNLDATQPGRIVINYVDHIQPIWERLRNPVDDGNGNLVPNCVSCHNSDDETSVAAGQLDLSTLPSDIDANHYRSYRELLSTDNEQWITTGGVAADRQRVCTEEDAEGNTIETVLGLPIRPSMRAGSAVASNGFFDCFSGGACGPNGQSPLPNNCSEEGGTVVPATTNTVNHQNLLSASELRLISEWLDIGGQYYNNPFDPRLADE